MKTAPSSINRPFFGFFVSMVIYALANVLFKYIQFMPHYADFRVSAFYPVMAGLFFGPWGALGCAAGNLISDFFGTLNYESPLGMLANFLFAWLPYRLWHTLLPFDGHKIQFISSTKMLIKYTLITSFSTMAAMSFLASGCDLIGVFDFYEFFRPVFLCNIYFALFMGTTFFLLASSLLPLELHIPQKLYAFEYCHKRYIPDYLLCAVVTLATAIRCLLSASADGAGLLSPAADLVILAGVLILACLPLRRSSRACEGGSDIKVTRNNGLQLQIITAFFVVISISTAYLIFFFLSSLEGFYDHARYTSVVIPYILKTVDVFGFVFILALIITLLWIERRISGPIMELAAASSSFVENGLHAEMPDCSRLSVEISLLAQSYRKMASDIESYVYMIDTHARREEHARLMLEMSAKIQMGMLPKPLADTDFSLASFIKPAKKVGGDFYYYAVLNDGRLLLCIADVSSKGMPAAMFAAEACMLVKCSRELPLDRLMAKVNNNLCEMNSENMFVTMFVGIIDRKKGSFEFINAGHNYPVIWRGKAAAWLESEPELALGIFSDVSYHLKSIDIDDSFQILLYTDGVVEAENTRHSFFGNERLAGLCQSLDTEALAPAAQLDVIVRQVEEFSAGAEQSDDITAVLAGICPTGC